MLTMFRSALLGFEPRTPAIGYARSLLALAQLSVLVFNPTDLLLPLVPDAPTGLRCDGIAAASLWCFGPSYGAWPTIARVVCALVLVAVSCGYRPRLTCLPHWYVSFSVAAALPMANGGDKVAQIVTMLILPWYLRDDRAWHWSRPVSPLPGGWQGAAYASLLALRVQTAAVYVDAALSKFVVPQWRQGSALGIIARHPNYGLPPDVVQLASRGGVPWLELATWAAMAVELAVGVLVLGRRRARCYALGLGFALHVSILVTMGLASFELVMMALLLLATNLWSARPVGDPADAVVRRTVRR